LSYIGKLSAIILIVGRIVKEQQQGVRISGYQDIREQEPGNQV